MIKLKDLLNERTAGIEYVTDDTLYDGNPEQNLKSLDWNVKTLLSDKEVVNSFKVVKKYNKNGKSHVIARIDTDATDRELERYFSKWTPRWHEINII